MNKSYKIFSDTVDDKTLEQFHCALSQPFVIKGALMPDAHIGYGLPIGAVMAADNIIVPSWVGYDIGCGICALKTDLTKADIDPYKKTIFKAIYIIMPTGKRTNKQPEQWDYSDIPRSNILNKLFQDYNGLKILASLGGGNHFIEISHDETDKIWIIIHSGSRGIGGETARYYMNLAKQQAQEKEGHHSFSVSTKLGKQYIMDMNFCLQYALENRKRMISKVYNEICFIVKAMNKNDVDIPFERLSKNDFINRNHNHAEYHQQEKVWIHRKGATHAEKGMPGVIPGNMKDGSFIVEGKGNPESLYSSSHGAGRVMSRKTAQESVQLNDFREAMTGIVAKVEHSTCDESPFAYKNIFAVMELQKDLVEVKHHLKPIINIKG